MLLVRLECNERELKPTLVLVLEDGIINHFDQHTAMCVYFYFSLEQFQYARKLKTLQQDAKFSHFSSMRMKLIWLVYSRPDCMCKVWQLSQITQERFNEDFKGIVKRTNRVVSYVVKNEIVIVFPALCWSNVQVLGYFDAYFVGNTDHTSQL